MATLRAKPPGKVKPKKPKFLIYGDGGVGKTWGMLDWSGVYLIDSEAGATREHYQAKLDAAGGMYMGPEDGANDINVVAAEVKALATTKHPYRTLVLDSYTKMFNTAIAQKYDVMEKANRDMDKTFGAEKKPAIAATRQMITWFDKLDMSVVLICHQKDLWEDGKHVGYTFDGWEKLKYELDMIVQIIKQGDSRKARIGKNRLEQFREGEIIDWSYATFANRLGAEVIESESTPVEPASAEQIRIVQQLIEIVRLDEELVTKWQDKAGVNSWGEMDADTIQKCIDYLKAKLPASAAVA
jgi:hypothetical protein